MVGQLAQRPWLREGKRCLTVPLGEQDEFIGEPRRGS